MLGETHQSTPTYRPIANSWVYNLTGACKKFLLYAKCVFQCFKELIQGYLDYQELSVPESSFREFISEKHYFYFYLFMDMHSPCNQRRIMMHLPTDNLLQVNLLCETGSYTMSQTRKLCYSKDDRAMRAI